MSSTCRCSTEDAVQNNARVWFDALRTMYRRRSTINCLQKECKRKCFTKNAVHQNDVQKNNVQEHVARNALYRNVVRKIVQLTGCRNIVKICWTDRKDSLRERCTEDAVQNMLYLNTQYINN